jgi:hypothetical protein
MQRLEAAQAETTRNLAENHRKAGRAHPHRRPMDTQPPPPNLKAKRASHKQPGRARQAVVGDEGFHGQCPVDRVRAGAEAVNVARSARDSRRSAPAGWRPHF